MKQKTRYTLLLFIPLGLFGLLRFSNQQINVFITKKEHFKEYSLAGVDGPYLFWRDDSLQIVEVTGANAIENRLIKPQPSTRFLCKVANEDRDQFSFSLQANPTTPPAVYAQPSKVLALSDIEGNFNAFYSLLHGNHVINEQYQWTFGDGHLVLVGDFVDRGENVTQCLWLIYKLEQEALLHGGRVHYILGNHEVMNLEYDFRYVHRKYLSLAMQLFGKSVAADAFPHLMSEKNVLVQWLRTHNCIEKIGATLYVHGGISEALLESKMSIEEINQTLHGYFQKMHDSLYVSDDRSVLINGQVGPLWYRGMVKTQMHSDLQADLGLVNRALRHFEVSKLVVGHTLVPEVSTDFKGKVVRLDIRQPNAKRSGKAQALLIEKGVLYRVNDLGERTLLK